MRSCELNIVQIPHYLSSIFFHHEQRDQIATRLAGVVTLIKSEYKRIQVVALNCQHALMVITISCEGGLALSCHMTVLKMVSTCQW